MFSRLIHTGCSIRRSFKMTFLVALCYLQLSLLFITHIIAVSFNFETHIRKIEYDDRYQKSFNSGHQNHPSFHGSGNLQYLYTKVDSTIQTKTAQEALKRILGDRHSEISISVNASLTGSPYVDLFSINDDPATGKIVIRGTTGVTALYGLNDYLKHHCGCHISWEGSQLSQLPYPLPKVTYNRTVLDRFRYYQNVCTDSYSFVWWNWVRWEKEIDWMALNGINMPLAFTGQEAIWQRVYLSLGLSAKDISEYISGPGFLAWWRMGNIGKWGGPMSQSFIDKKIELLHKILLRMRSFGMLPVLPAFSGNVPYSLKKMYPNVTLIQHPSWNRFNSSYVTYMLEPGDPLFHSIGTRFIKELLEEVGTDHVYNCDTFNENDPTENTTEFLRNSAQVTYEAMSSGDSKAVWLMQSWVFRSKFWQDLQVQAYLSGVDKGNVLILDLEADRKPLYEKFKNFFGHNFIWCMLQNYGGTMNLYGSFDLVNNGISYTRDTVKSGEFVGIGSCPEGINQNSVIFDFMHEMSLHPSSIVVSEWVQAYAERRYGVKNDFIQESWDILRNGVYNAPVSVDNHGRSIITRRPSLKLAEDTWYNLSDIRIVLDHFINAMATSDCLRNSTLYQHDLVDFTRQFLQNLGAETYKALIQSYYSKKLKNFQRHATNLKAILDDLETILGTNANFLLGKWIQNAEAWGISKEVIQRIVKQLNRALPERFTFLQEEKEKELLKFNALNQITLWGPNGEIVDYASKQWAGTVGSYYKPRWERFISALNSSLVSGKRFNWKVFRKDVLINVEIPFTLSKKAFPTLPQGDSITETVRIYTRWAKLYMKFVKRKEKYRQG